MHFFSQKTATLKTPKNQTNSKQLQNTNIIGNKENQNKNTPGCVYDKEKENQKEKREKDKSKKDSSCNFPKTITADYHKNNKTNGEKNEKSVFVIV